MLRFLKKRFYRDMPKIDVDRIYQCARMIEQVQEYTEPSRTKFRAKYAHEILHIIREHEREVYKWAYGRKGI